MTRTAHRVRGRARNKPKSSSLLLPYQVKWVKDTSRLKLMEKSRQIGISWATAYAIVSRKALANAKQDAWVSSRDDLQARLFLNDCKAFSGILNLAAQDLGEKAIDEDGKHSAYVLRMANGLHIHSMSSNPDAQAGKRGDRILDEFALHPDPRKLYSIAYPGITWGGQLEMVSTHRGSHNFFNSLITEVKDKGNPKNISLHRVTLEDALNDGFLGRLQEKLPNEDPRLDMDEAEYFDFIKSGCADRESFQQEYCCVPADDAAAFLSYELIDTCILRGEQDMRAVRENVGKNGYIRTFTNHPIKLDKDTPCFLGIDLARVGDLTVMWLGTKLLDVFVPLVIVEMSNVDFARQEQVMHELFSNYRILRACIDQSGLGRQFTERAQKRYGEYRIEGVNFTAQNKEALAYPVRSAFEDRAVRVPSDRHLVADLRAIRKTTTTTGAVRFDGERGTNGHADRFWALALALEAGRTTYQPFYYQPVTSPRAETNPMRTRRRRTRRNSKVST